MKSGTIFDSIIITDDEGDAMEAIEREAMAALGLARVARLRARLRHVVVRGHLVE